MAGGQIDQRLRAWMKREGTNTVELGKELHRAGLASSAKAGQTWTSGYMRGVSGTATLDHVSVIARFHGERTIEELLSEITSDLGRHTGKEGSAFSHSGGPPDAQRQPDLSRVLAAKDARIAELERALKETETVATELVRIAVVGRKGRAADGARAQRRGRG